MKLDVNAILDYWFADSATSMETYEQRKELWFMNSDSFDEEIKSLCEPCLELAASGSESHLENQPKGILTLIIVLDQFPRNIYRGTPKAFSYDAESLRLTKKAIDTGMDKSLAFVERLFAYMPLQHSENIEVQNLSVTMFESLIGASENSAQKLGAEQSLEYAHIHKDIIEEFGRFPHRNEILGRLSTNEELRYLSGGGENFGQVKK